jgi:hypothetical protein
MGKTRYLLIFIVLSSCTSNTIFEKPKDLIPKDTMSLLLQEMMISASAKFTKNKSQQKNINYMPIVFEKFRIDSTRFKSSNQYYISTIDEYQVILERSKAALELRHDILKKTKTTLDSLRKVTSDSIRNRQVKLDSLKIIRELNITKNILSTE